MPPGLHGRECVVIYRMIGAGHAVPFYGFDKVREFLCAGPTARDGMRVIWGAHDLG